MGIKTKNLFLMVFVFLLTIYLYWLFLGSDLYKDFELWVFGNKTLFTSYLFIFKFVSILWPPFAGGIATLASIPLVGWVNAYLIDLVGSVVGGSISYYLGNKYGYKILDFLFDKEVIEKINKIKVRKNREIETVFIYRVFFGSTIIEAIYYGAGYLKINYFNFLCGAILSHIVVGVPAFYFSGNLISGENLFITVLSILLGIPFFIKYKNRHFE